VTATVNDPRPMTKEMNREIRIEKNVAEGRRETRVRTYKAESHKDRGKRKPSRALPDLDTGRQNTRKSPKHFKRHGYKGKKGLPGKSKERSGG